MPRFNSHTRRAARINRFVRAIVPTPGNGRSSVEKSKSDARERFTRPFGLRLRGTGRNASRSGNMLSKDVDEFMFEIENQQSGVGGTPPRSLPIRQTGAAPTRNVPVCVLQRDGITESVL